jgi:NTE family protein
MKSIERLNRPLSVHDRAGCLSGCTRPRKGPDDWVVLLALSGGGTRAAALGFGVLEELAGLTFQRHGQSRRMIDAIDTISAVSGGSFPAAYYALYGDRLFQDFEKLFLKHDVHAAIIGRMLQPQNWLPLVAKRLGRTDLAGDYYDEEIFGGATFADLARHAERPELLIHATDMVTGLPFAFTQRNFNLINSDLSALPLARAVAASSAAPLLLSPLTLRNYSAQDPEAKTFCTERINEEARRAGAPEALATAMRSYLDGDERPFIHLVDGGVADNLGLRGLLDVSAMSGGFGEMLAQCRFGDVSRLAIIVVNAAARHSSRWNHGGHPGMVDVIQAVSEQITHRNSARTITEFRAELERWRAAGSANPSAAPRIFHIVDIDFDHFEDPAEREFFLELPTSFSLPARTIDRLREAGHRLLRESDSFRRLRADFEKPAMPAVEAVPA